MMNKNKSKLVIWDSNESITQNIMKIIMEGFFNEKDVISILNLPKNGLIQLEMNI